MHRPRIAHSHPLSSRCPPCVSVSLSPSQLSHAYTPQPSHPTPVSPRAPTLQHSSPRRDIQHVRKTLHAPSANFCRLQSRRTNERGNEMKWSKDKAYPLRRVPHHPVLNTRTGIPWRTSLRKTKTTATGTKRWQRQRTASASPRSYLGDGGRARYQMAVAASVNEWELRARNGANTAKSRDCERIDEGEGTPNAETKNTNSEGARTYGRTERRDKVGRWPRDSKRHEEGATRRRDQSTAIGNQETKKASGTIASNMEHGDGEIGTRHDTIGWGRKRKGTPRLPDQRGRASPLWRATA
ncbi:hypothetical protein AB1N83_013583 [Pleurotus pulmonarius]